MLRRTFVLALVGMSCAVSTARAQVKLEYKFPEGSKSKYQHTTKTHQILSINGMDIETEAEQVIEVSSSVGQRKPDGTLPVTQKIESFRTKMTLPGGINLNFDSADPNAKIENPQLAFLGDLFKSMVGISYTLVLDANNKVKFIEGTESLDAKLDGLDPKAATMLRSLVSVEKLKRSFEQEHSNMPDVLARQGESWEGTDIMELEADQTLTFRKRYEYLGTVERAGKTLDKIGVRVQTVVYAMDPKSASPLKATKSDLKIDSSEGTILFDRETGDRVESKLVTHVKGDLTLEAGGKELPTTLDLTLDTKGRLEALPK